MKFIVNLKSVSWSIIFFYSFTCISVSSQTLKTSANNISLEKQTFTSSNSISDVNFSNVSRINDRCVLIGGNAFKTNNFFVDSCIEGWNIKIVDSIGYIKDMNFLVEQAGWMILSGSIVKIDNDKLIPQTLGKIENAYFDKILFIDDLRGWAVGWKGRIITTNDGGASWKEQKSPTQFTLNDIVFSSPGKGWIIGSNFENGKIEYILLRTKNAGNKWEKIEQEQAKGFTKLFFLDSLRGWAITQDGAMAATKNGGITWKYNVSENTFFKDIFFTDKLNGWGVNENVFYTRDGGKTWKNQTEYSEGSSFDFKKIIFVDENNGWVMAQDKILQTTNSGMTWEELKIPFTISNMLTKK